MVSGVVWVIVIVTAVALLRGMTKRLGWSIKEELKNIRKT
jgi:hypothetical protein